MIDATFKLRCNLCRMWLNYCGVTNFDPAIHTYAAVRKMARKLGWKRKDSRDLCPDCIALSKGTEAVAA